MKIHYNSKLARLLTFVEGFGTIMLFGAVFTENESLPRRVIEHEKIHVEQYQECFYIGLVLGFLAVILTNWVFWLLILPVIMFYIIYLGECFVSFIVNCVKVLYAHISGKPIPAEWLERPYMNCAFEQEARQWQDEWEKPCEKRKSRGSLGWFKFYGKI